MKKVVLRNNYLRLFKNVALKSKLSIQKLFKALSVNGTVSFLKKMQTSAFWERKFPDRTEIIKQLDVFVTGTYL